jgi:hypothetical protein
LKLSILCQLGGIRIASGLAVAQFVRNMAVRIVDECDHELGNTNPPDHAGDPARWRKSGPGLHPPLNRAGVAEIERRFAAGENNDAIAIAMRVSPDGVARRRAMWRGRQAVAA